MSKFSFGPVSSRLFVDAIFGGVGWERSATRD